MSRLGELDAWLDATARAAEPAVRFSSVSRFTARRCYVVPPRNVWPPPPSSKVRFKGARFVPLKVVETLLAGRPLDGGELGHRRGERMPGVGRRARSFPHERAIERGSGPRG